MKYLKKIFESNLMLDTNDIGDILQEISDLGYLSNVESNWWSDDSGNRISICIYGKKEYDKKFNCEVAYIYPDDIMEVVERLVDFLGTENYVLEEDSKKTIEAIKNRPIEPVKKGFIKNFEIKLPISKMRAVNMRWDENKEVYKISYSLSISFRTK